MGEARRAGLRAAAGALARTMIRVAMVKTTRGASRVNVAYQGDYAIVRAGKPEGVYGWEPIQALMFDDNKRHPLFGDKKHWYHQGHYPITEDTVRLGADEAAEAYADAAVDLMLDEHGFPK
jgi:hypothetical protein